MLLGEWLASAPFGLAMSSGFFSFYAHTGMLSALVARGLAPERVAGSSAGALVGGAYAAGVEPAELAAVLAKLDRTQFWDPSLGAGLLAGNKLDRLLREMLPATAFAACRMPIAISAFDIRARKTAVLASGDLPLAIRASCAVPAMFHPVWIDGRAYWDGGILDRPGVAGVPTGRVLYHHIASRWGRPRRDDLVTLVIEGLPQSGPFRLDAGRRAMQLAHDATLRALDQPIIDLDERGGRAGVEVRAG